MRFRWRNYYLEDLDISLLNEIWTPNQKFAQAVINTAWALLATGHVDSFYGMCLEADAEKKMIRTHAMELKY